jgi:hypothetical protein
MLFAKASEKLLETILFFVNPVLLLYVLRFSLYVGVDRR